MAKAGLCPICLIEFMGLHCHHVIPRELTLNNIKGIDGPVVYICSTCHDLLHRQANSIIAQTNRQYFTDVQRTRVANLLKILVAAMHTNKDHITTGQVQKVVLQFTKEDMELLHAAKQDHGSTNLSHFLEGLIRKALNRL